MRLVNLDIRKKKALLHSCLFSKNKNNEYSSRNLVIFFKLVTELMAFFNAVMDTVDSG